MYSLKVVKGLRTPDGRIFIEGDVSTGLTALEAKELMDNYPGRFEPNDEATKKLFEVPE